MSNKAPKINPTGTVYKNVPVYKKHRHGGPTNRSEHAASWNKMMKVVEEYIKADFIVEYSEEDHGDNIYANVTCRNPLFPEDIVN